MNRLYSGMWKRIYHKGGHYWTLQRGVLMYKHNHETPMRKAGNTVSTYDGIGPIELYKFSNEPFN